MIKYAKIETKVKVASFEFQKRIQIWTGKQFFRHVTIWMEWICFQDLKKFRLVRTCTYKQSNKSKHTVYGAENNVKIKPEIGRSAGSRTQTEPRVATSLSEIIFVDWFKFSEKWDPILIISIFVSDIGSRHFIVNLKNISLFWISSDANIISCPL